MCVNNSGGKKDLLQKVALVCYAHVFDLNTMTLLACVHLLGIVKRKHYKLT